MEVTKKPKIKSIPYEEFTDNETLEKLVRELNAGGANVAIGVLDDFIDWGRSNSLWPLTFATSCCGIEFMALGAARYDMARFGFEVARASPRQADMIMVCGTITNKMAPVLKRFIITCTRIARARFGVGQENERTFDVVRRFYVLVDQYFREKKQVQDYADMLCRSPKTLSNLFSACGLPSPLRIIHERIDAEARRLLLYTRKSAKEISAILGFEDLAAFSRFFKKMTGESVSEYRKQAHREELPTVTE